MNRPQIGVALAIRKDNKVLLHKRKGDHAPNTWAFPGGHQEMWETWDQTAMRELLEEAGNSIACTKPVFWTAADCHHVDEGKHYNTILMVADWICGEARVVEPNKNDGWQWFEWDGLPSPLMLGIQDAVNRGLSPFNVGSKKMNSGELAYDIAEALSIGGRTYPNRLSHMMIGRARRIIYDVIERKKG